MESQFQQLADEGKQPQQAQPQQQPTQPAGTQSASDGLASTFQQMADTDKQAQPVQTTATISAIHEPTTFLGKFGRWAENVSNDMKYGTDETGIGTVLKKMGAHGVYMGNPEAVGDF